MDVIKLMESMSLTGEENNSSDYLSFYKSIGVKINDIPTDIIYADHENRLLIIVSQYQKFGALLSVNKEQIEHLGSSSEPVYTVKPLFGNEDPQQQAAARFIAEKLNIQKPLNIFLCLNNYDPNLVKALVDILLDVQSKL